MAGSLRQAGLAFKQRVVGILMAAVPSAVSLLLLPIG